MLLKIFIVSVVLIGLLLTALIVASIITPEKVTTLGECTLEYGDKDVTCAGCGLSGAVNCPENQKKLQA